ncbi:MAG: hypothetical protein WD876_00840 [Candidatus Pacearchaeota archaeon]
MSLNDVLLNSIIPFPWTLTLKQVEDLTDHVGKIVKGLVKYDIAYSRKAGYEAGIAGFLRKKQTSSEGSITLPFPPFTYGNFNFIHHKKDSLRIRGIQFQTQSDKKLSDYKPEIVQLWDDVRTAINSYFDDNSDTDRSD